MQSNGAWLHKKLLTTPYAFETQMRNIQMRYANKMEAERINIISRLKDFEQRLDAVENQELGTLMRLIEQTRILQTYITYQGRGVEQLFEKVQGKIKRAREGFFASRRASDYIVDVNTRGIGSFLSESMGPKAAEVAELFNLSLDDVDIPPGFVVIRAGIEYLIEANRQQAGGQERLAAIEQMIAAPMSHRAVASPRSNKTSPICSYPNSRRAWRICGESSMGCPKPRLYAATHRPTIWRRSRKPQHIRTIRNCQARLVEMGEKNHFIIVDNSADVEEALNTIMRRVNDPIADRGLPVADAIRDAVQMDIEKRESQIRVSRFNGAWVTDIDDTLLESGAHPTQAWIEAQVAFIRKLQTLNIVWVPMSGVAIEKAGPRLIYRFPHDVRSHVIYYGGDGSAKLSYDLKSDQWLEDQSFKRHFSDAQAMAIIGEKALAQVMAARLECTLSHERVQTRLREAREELAAHRIEGQKGIIAALEARLAAEGFPPDAAVTYFHGIRRYQPRYQTPGGAVRGYTASKHLSAVQ
jgi:hypothetical protein